MSKIQKILRFKQVYVETQEIADIFEEQLDRRQFDEATFQLALARIDEMLALLPFEFPERDQMYTSQNIRILIINLSDVYDNPKQIVTHEGGTWYTYPENTVVLYENTAPIVLENWKFNFLNKLTHELSDPAVHATYLPRMLAQAHRCVSLFPEDKPHFEPWEADMFIIYANQIGWFAFLNETDPQKLEEAYRIVERGFLFSNWEDKKYIKDTKVRLALKLNKPDDAYPIVYEAFEQDKNYVDFLDLKNDPAYQAWKKEAKKRDKESTNRKEEEHKAYLKTVKEKQAEVLNQFKNPDHPLVKQHADTLNLIKQRMVGLRFRKIYRQSGWEKLRNRIDTDYKDYFSLKPWTEEMIQEFEEKNQLPLPDELKVYLMEIGEGGGGYFEWGSEITPKSTKKELKQMQKPFPITGDKVHVIDKNYPVKVWTYPNDEDLTDLKHLKRILGKNADLQQLFGLPAGTDLKNGCLYLGPSWDQNELFLILNGEFAGEVWADTLQYGVEAGGCFGPATLDRRKFLSFIAGSLLAHQQGYVDAERGNWL